MQGILRQLSFFQKVLRVEVQNGKWGGGHAERGGWLYLCGHRSCVMRRGSLQGKGHHGLPRRPWEFSLSYFCSL